MSRPTRSAGAPSSLQMGESADDKDRSATKAIVVGAGPVGCATALALSKLGYKVEVYESRDDPRRAQGQLRSINLAMSARGIDTLAGIDAGLAQRLGNEFVPMTGRMLHSMTGAQSSVAYGAYGESIKSISRLTLNQKLVDELQRAGVKTYFKHKLVSMSVPGQPELRFELEHGTQRVKADFVIGCDGAFSKVRSELGKQVDFNFSQEYIDFYYIEMTIPPSSSTKKYVYDANHLHIWPRGDFMFIALPNADQSFTGTLFAGRQVLADLDTPAKFSDFFKQQFPDAFNVIGGDALSKFFDYPRGRMISIKCEPYNYQDKVLILGDAAHSIVPFYGQGLNAGLEDVRVLVDLLRQQRSRTKAFEAYSANRKADLDAINDLSMQNFVEMRDSGSKRPFLLRKALDKALTRVLGDRWLPLYTMVAFRPDVSYSEAVSRNKRQNAVLSMASRTVELASLVVALALGYRYRQHLRRAFTAENLREFARVVQSESDTLLYEAVRAGRQFSTQLVQLAQNAGPQLQAAVHNTVQYFR